MFSSIRHPTADDSLRRAKTHRLSDFPILYHVDLNGNVYKNPSLSGTTHNVFGIKPGVGITIAVKPDAASRSAIRYHRVQEDWRKRDKLAYLDQLKDVRGVVWSEVTPDEQAAWLTQGMAPDFDDLLPLGYRETKGRPEQRCIFGSFTLGLSTNRDEVVYAFDRDALEARCRAFVDHYNAEVGRWYASGKPPDVDAFVQYDHIKWSRDLKADLQRGRLAEYDDTAIRRSLYRPFCTRYLYFDRLLNEEVYSCPLVYPTPAQDGVNTAICATGVAGEKPFVALATDRLPNLHLVGAGCGTQCFPLYIFNEDGTNRRDNITDWALAQFQGAYGTEVTRLEIFHYVYAILHHPAYRERYAVNLKRELPRIPRFPAPRRSAPLPPPAGN